MKRERDDHGRGRESHDQDREAHHEHERSHILIGTRADDLLVGSDHNDFILGLKGNDVLDGGAGSDVVLGGRGDDTLIYSMSGNLGAGFADVGARDYYDGGSGSDTLKLELTYGEAALPAVQKDIAALQALLDAQNAPQHGHAPALLAAQAPVQGGGNGQAFHFTAFDLTVRHIEAVTIELVNHAPVAAADAAATDEDTPITVSAAQGVLANDHDPDHLDVVSIAGFEAASAMGAAVTLAADGSYSYDPTGAHALQALAQGETATDSFHYTIVDLAGATSSATVEIAVTGVNDAPVAAPDAFTLAEDTPLAVAGPGVLANDSDIDSPSISALLVSGPAHGSLALNPDGSLSYAPDANYNGSDGFVYRANDGIADSAPVAVALTITEVNDAPVAVDDAATLDEDTTITLDVLANDSAGPANESGQTLAVIAASADHGTVTINPDGTLTYAPEANANGEFAVSYTIRDDGTTDGAPDPKTASATLHLTVNPVNDPPVAVDDHVATNEDTPIAGNVLDGSSGGLDTDVDGDALAVSSVGNLVSALGAAVTLAADGTFSYDPTGSGTLQALVAGQSASDSFGYTISDGHGGTASATVTVDVAGLAEPQSGSNAVLPSIAPGANLDYYIKFDGVGDGKWLSLGAFDLAFDNPVSLSSGGGGAGAGRATASDLHSLLGTSALSVELAAALAAGEHIKDVQIEAYLPGGDKAPVLIDEFKFSDVLMDGLQTSNGGINSVSFAYGSYGQTHVSYDPNTGAQDGTTGVGWDFVQNTSSAAPAAQPEAAKAPLEPQVGPGANLAYYVHFDGIDGWLQVDAFSLGLSNAVSLGSGGGGASAGRAVASDVNLALGMSSALVQLEGSLFGGEHLKDAQIEVYQAGGKAPQLVDEFQFKDVLVSSVSSGDVTNNSLSFAYGAYSHGHVTYDAKGAIADTTVAGWDFEANHAISGPAPHPDVDLFA